MRPIMGPRLLHRFIVIFALGAAGLATALPMSPAQQPSRPATIRFPERTVLNLEPDLPSPLPSERPPHSTSEPAATGPIDWDAIAYCESHDQWDINAGTFWGGLQFLPSTWFAYGGGPFDGVGWFPYSREEQIAVAERVLAAQGPGAWPVCWYAQ